MIDLKDNSNIKVGDLSQRWFNFMLNMLADIFLICIKAIFSIPFE